MLKKIEIIPLALKKMKQRKVAEEMVRDVLGTPGQTVDGYMGRKVGQKIFYDEKDERLLRVVYEETEEKFMVITAYFTSKVKRYWKGGKE